jgi:hypothetical protein
MISRASDPNTRISSLTAESYSQIEPPSCSWSDKSISPDHFSKLLLPISYTRAAVSKLAPQAAGYRRPEGLLRPSPRVVDATHPWVVLMARVRAQH